jgi:hypothetical protein
MVKYIFSINTGRSGSHYLSKVLKEFKNINSFHEPFPIMNGKPMAEFLQGNPLKMREKMEEKINTINSSFDKKYYIETNHTFIKGFGWLIPSYIAHENIGVILLKRNSEEIIKSLYRINCSPLTYKGFNWIMNPVMKNPINKVSNYDKLKYRILFFISGLSKSKKKSFSKRLKVVKKFELKFLEWYVKETYAQANKFKNEFPKIKIYETTVEKLNDVQEFQKMFDFFGLDFLPKESFYEKVNEKTNLKKYYNKT